MPNSDSPVTSPDPARRLSVATILGGLFFVSYLVFQTLSAGGCFLADIGCNLTWTMYSGRRENPQVFVVWKSGGEAAYESATGVKGVGRIIGAKVDWEPFLPPYLCEHLPDAEAVRLEFARSGREEVISCP